MMINAGEDITHIINSIARQENVAHIRIFQKDGHIKFSNLPEEVTTYADINDYACAICHKHDPPPTDLSLNERARFFSSPEGQRYLGIVNPIYNEAGCSSASCHVHSPETKVLGTLDTVISLEQVDKNLHLLELFFASMTVLIFLVTAALVFLYLLRFVSRPVQKMITGTQIIANGEIFNPSAVERHDELGRLAAAISKMGEEISRQKNELLIKNRELTKANKELEKLSTIDSLTGLYNRRYFIGMLEAEHRRSVRYGHRLSILMIDVDFFKKVNDQHGHICGDQLLKEIAKIIKKTVRGTDMVARYGGEEMVVLLLETDSGEAASIGEKLRYAVESNGFIFEDEALSITVSIGGATQGETWFEKPMQLLAAADDAMYMAKRAGRNTVRYFT